MGQIPSARLRILQLPRPPGARLRASPHAPSQKPPSTLASNTDGKVDETADSHHTGNLNQNSLNRSLCFKRVSYVLPSLSQRPCCLGLFCPPLKMTKFLWMAPSNWTGQNLHRSEQATLKAILPPIIVLTFASSSEMSSRFCERAILR